MRTLTICADDFGLKTAVNTAICALVRQGRLNAVSCMTVGSCVSQDDMTALRDAITAAPHRVDIGLHFTLTEYRPLGPMSSLAPEGNLPSIGRLMMRSSLGLLRRGEIEGELKRQWDAFISVVGRPPDFIDGHQHVHTLAVIRDVVLAAAKGCADGTIWVRSCTAPTAEIAGTRIAVGRALLIAGLSRRLAQTLRAQHVPTNDAFFGINCFDRHVDFGNAMRAWLHAAGKDRSRSTLLMCHPGAPPISEDENSIHDPISDRRPDEYTYLSSSTFLEDLSAHGFDLAMDPIA